MLSSLSLIRQSYSVAFADYVRARETEGRVIVKMQTGDPDFPTHPRIVRAAHEAMKNGQTKYCDSRGLLGLRNALAEKLLAENGVACSGRDNLLITHGAVHGIGMALRALLNPGDECIIIEPFWRAYEMNVFLAGGVPIVVKAKKEAGFQLDADAVIQRITPRTKAIIINTPNNPSGAVYHRTELIKLAKAAAGRGVYIVSDEVYESLVFGEERHYSIASDPEVFDWTISAFSFSKTFAMTGWRLGYVVANARVIDEILKLSQVSVTSLCTFSQLAAITALQDADVRTYVTSMRNAYEKRRNQISDAVRGTWLDLAMVQPQGAFYSLIDVGRFNVPSIELAKKIVDRFNVSLTPGIAFGDGMDRYLRMCFATSEENINTAITALLQMDSLTV